MASVLFEKKDGIAYITLNRPEKFNAFNREMALLLQSILDDCQTDESVRCVYLTGNGKAFSAGQDLAELVGDNAPTLAQILSEHYNPIVIKMRNLSKPIVTAINGVAAGAGANIALQGDVVVSIDTASFIQAFSKIGLIPDSGGTYILPRLIGFQKASALMMLGDKIEANEALQMGMLYKVFTTENFEIESKKIAQALAQMPTKALAYTKQALNQSNTNSFEQQLQLEDILQQQSAITLDYNEGVAAFLEKRKPVFKGK
jgi:2-(1,2-epoxy-1,2-dihydrophenyl)acetyl-CoA isomerase